MIAKLESKVFAEELLLLIEKLLQVGNKEISNDDRN